MSTIKMFGPSIDGSGKVVNRDIEECDEQAYVAVGYQRGTVDEKAVAAEAKAEAKEEAAGEG